MNIRTEMLYEAEDVLKKLENIIVDGQFDMTSDERKDFTRAELYLRFAVHSLRLHGE